MKFVYVLVPFLALSGAVHAATFTVATQSGTTTSTSTITVEAPLPASTAADVHTRINTLVQDISRAIGYYDDEGVLLGLQAEFAALTLRAGEMTQATEIDEDVVAALTADLKTLLLKVTELVLRDNKGTRAYVPSGSDDTWVQDSIFGRASFAPDSLSATTTASGGQVGAGGATVSTPDSCVVKFGTNFRLGASSAEVRAVQVYLNSNTETLLAQSGVGSPSNESDYFGTLTLEAVKKFQTKYTDEVLVSVGLSEATGYWGPSTRKQANKLNGCAQ